MSRLFLILTLIGALASCSADQPAERDAIELVRRQLAIPESAQFRDVHYVAQTKAVCGLVKSRKDATNFDRERKFYVVAGKALIEPDAELPKPEESDAELMLRDSRNFKREAGFLSSHLGFCSPH